MSNANRVLRDNSQNRRGLLLGLTLAEIMMIILFALLLLFGVVFSEQEQEKERHRQLDADSALAQSALAVVDYLVSAAATAGIGSTEVDDLMKELKQLESLSAELAALGDKDSNLTPAQSADVAEKRKDLERRQVVLTKAVDERARKMQAAIAERQPIAQVAQKLANDGVTPEKATEAVSHMAAQSSVMSDLRQRLEAAKVPGAKIDSILDAAQKQWADTAMDNRNLSEQSLYWKTRWESVAGNAGRGVTPCWATGGKVDFIYDIAVTDEGMVLRFNNPPQWAEDYARLPVERIALASLLTQGQFMDMTRPLFEYSEVKNCRFFVRLFDETSEFAKKIYQQRRRAVEGHFYIDDMKDARF